MRATSTYVQSATRGVAVVLFRRKPKRTAMRYEDADVFGRLLENQHLRL